MAELMAVYHSSLWKHPPLNHGAMAPAAPLQVHPLCSPAPLILVVVSCSLSVPIVHASAICADPAPSIDVGRFSVAAIDTQSTALASRPVTQDYSMFGGLAAVARLLQLNARPQPPSPRPNRYQPIDSSAAFRAFPASAISSISSSVTTTATRSPRCAEPVAVARFQAARPQASLIHQRSHLTASLFCGSQRVTGTCGSMDQF